MYYYGIQISTKDKAKLEAIENQVWDLYEGKIDQVTAHHKITGTMTKMDGELLQFYHETIEEIFGAADLDYAEPYYIINETIRGVDDIIVYLLSAAAGITLLIMILFILGYLRGNHDKYVKKFLEENQKYSESALEIEFGGAQKIGKNVWASKRFTFYQKGAFIRILINENLVWAYYFYRTGKNSQSLVRTFDINQKQVDINLNKVYSEQLLRHYLDTQPHIVLGFDKELQKIYKNDYKEFLDIKYNQAKAESEFEQYQNNSNIVE